MKIAPQRQLLHAVERHDETDHAVAERKQPAQASWDVLYENGSVLPCHYWKYKRTAKEIGDPRPLPYLKDVLEFAMNQAQNDDIIFWTNDDNILHPQLPAILNFCVSAYDVVCSQRCDIRRPMPVNLMKPEEMSNISENHMGRDLFAFKKSWLVEHWEELPDFILGCSDFDLALCAMVRFYHGIKSTRDSFFKHIFPAEIPRGYIMHQMHKSHWARPDYVHVAAGQQHNRKLWKAWAEVNLPELKFTAQNCI